jgi:hypothetical protein
MIFIGAGTARFPSAWVEKPREAAAVAVCLDVSGHEAEQARARVREHARARSRTLVVNV